MIQNPAHVGDIVSPIDGKLEGQRGTIVALRLKDNRCQVRFAPEDDPNDYHDHQYLGHRLTLIKCKHPGVITSEEQSNV